jgi:hypothetical protein
MLTYLSASTFVTIHMVFSQCMSGPFQLRPHTIANGIPTSQLEGIPTEMLS